VADCTTAYAADISIAAVPSSAQWSASSWSAASWSSQPTQSTASATPTVYTPAVTFTPSSTYSTWTAGPSYIPTPCSEGQELDVELNICVDICLGVLNAVGVCVKTDLDIDADLPLVGGLL